MAKNKQINPRSFQEGKIRLYQLEGRPRQFWYARIKRPKRAGYEYRGTGTSDVHEAYKVASNFLDDLKYKAHGEPSISGPTFQKLIEEFEKKYHLEACTPGRAKAVNEFLRCYAVPYFSGRRAPELSEREIVKFFDWRRANFKRTPPKASTIVSEMGKLKVFTDWCHARGHLPAKIEYKKPPISDNPRPAFSAEEWRKLRKFIPDWAKEGKTLSGPIFRDRFYLGGYIFVLGFTGIRVGEARGLRWCDIVGFHDQKGKKQIEIQVNGKTGQRDVIARTAALQDAFDGLKKHRAKESEADPPLREPIFCHPNGTPIKSFKKGFNALIKAAGLEYSTSGERRTAYSLRHTYATIHMQEGVSVLTLARNMGTSVKMIEKYYGHARNREMVFELQKYKTQKTQKNSPDDQS